MAKKEIKPGTYLYPMPVVLVGANVNGKPTYMTAAWCNIVDDGPPLIAVSMDKVRFTSIGIKANGTFSVNIPSADLMAVTDYTGIYSGHKVDKSQLFETFYGKLENAPMIRECPLNLECRVHQILPLNASELFIGEIVAAYTEEQYLSNDEPDIRKINPLIFSMPDNNYWKVGEHLGQAFSVGKKLRSTPALGINTHAGAGEVGGSF